jgi:leucyl-tRNA synthetase
MSDDIRDNRENRTDFRTYDFRAYDFCAIEAKWQRRWEETDLFRVDNQSDRPKFYGLDMFPYPSGAGISVGHCRNYVPLDVACRLKVMQGYNVLHPIGWDAFGQPAENEAIKRGRNPRDMVPEYAANYKRQLKLVGISYDWSREVNSSLPDYYRWTQWIFLLHYKRGLAYRASNTAVNWCPKDKTVLANEEVVNGRCWRCETLVEKRYIPQWFFKITAYADRLLQGLDTIQWPEGVKTLQANWIGRSEGAEVDFPIAGWEEDTDAPESIQNPKSKIQNLRVFTTRPDTLWGATFMVLAPEHPLVPSLTTPEHRAEVEEYRERAQRISEIDRQSTERTKTGVFTGAYAVNPVNGNHIPIWIADYVLMGYGTGAIMAVPAHDQRDFEFARKYDIPIRLVYRLNAEQSEETMTEATPQGGVMIHSGPFDGSPNDKNTVRKVIEYLEEKGIGVGRVNFRLRDWLISRQRYWGVPIPIIHCAQCGIVPVPEDQLPVLLPDVENYQPTGTGESPLAAVPEFVNTVCPQCGGPARRETDTMGGSACSSWYFLRFADPHNEQVPFDTAIADYWLPVDMYAGGAEHAVGHLLYSRFWTKVLYDAGLIHFDEPFQRYRNQGMVLAYTPGREVKKDEAVNATGDEEGDGDEPLENWKVLKPEERVTVPQDQWVWRWTKMSKSKGNVVTPDEMAEKYGADSLRLFTLFVAPYEDNVQWTDKGIEGAHRFVNRVWRIWTDLYTLYLPDWRAALPALTAQADANHTSGEDQNWTDWGEDERKLRRKLHQTIRKVGEDLENFRFNTAVAALMELTNELSAYRNALGGNAPSPSQAVLLSEIIETLPLLMSPITPHLSDEWWEMLGNTESTFKQPWPTFDPAAAAEESVEIVVQVNGKIKDRMLVAVGTPKEELERLALEMEKVKADLNGKQIRKVITVPGRLVNVVIG